MKLIVCCLFLIVNITDTGNASLESFAPSSDNMLFEDSAKSSECGSHPMNRPYTTLQRTKEVVSKKLLVSDMIAHYLRQCPIFLVVDNKDLYIYPNKCHRPCKFNVQPKRCYYNFKIEPAIDDDGKSEIAINGISPGPPINVCVNDVIVVEVTNNIPDQFISMHWHGVEQKGTPYMDGVPMVTQCPIGYKSSYKYAFIASSAGTFFYHSDSVSQQSDGVYGSLIVNQPLPLEPHVNLYDFDKSEESTLIVGAKFPKLLTGSLEDISSLRPTSLVINGDEESFKLFVMPWYAYRLRIVNAIAIECPIIANIDKHEMLIIASDGNPVKPALVKNIQLNPGERMDVVVRATEKSGGFWLKIRGTGICEDLEAKAMLLYVGFNYTSMLQDNHINPEQPQEVNLDSDIVISSQMLESLQPVQETPNQLVRQVYLGIDRNIVKVKPSEHDFRYISDAIPKKPFYSAAFSLKEKGVVQINGKSFLYPNTPILLKPKEVRTDMICKVGEESRNKEPQCIQIINAVQGEVLEIAMVNEGKVSNDSYTFHMHGFTMQINEVWQDPSGKPLTRSRFIQLEQQGKIIRNLQNPPVKNSVTVPNKGYSIVRIRPDRGGSWLLECRSCSLSSLPAAVIINVPQPIPKPVLDSLPTCGNYRPPDVLLN